MIRGFKTGGVVQPGKHSSIAADTVNTTKATLHHDNFVFIASDLSVKCNPIGSNLSNLLNIFADITGHAGGFARPASKIKAGDFSKQIIVSSDNPIDITFHHARKEHFTFGRSFGQHGHGGRQLGHKTMPNCLIQHKLLGKALTLQASGYIKTPRTATDPEISFILEQNYFNHHAGSTHITSDKLMHLTPVALRPGLIPWSIQCRFSGSVACSYSIVIDGVTHSGSGQSNRSKDNYLEISIAAQFIGGILGHDTVEVVMTELQLQ